MLQNVAHSQYLTLMQGFNIKLSLLRLPSIPYNFLTTTAAKASASTIRLLTKTLPRNIKSAQNSSNGNKITAPDYTVERKSKDESHLEKEQAIRDKRVAFEEIKKGEGGGKRRVKEKKEQKAKEDADRQAAEEAKERARSHKAHNKTPASDKTRVASLVWDSLNRCAKRFYLGGKNNLNLATEFLLASPILVQRARDEESTRNQTNSNASRPSTEAADPTVLEPSNMNDGVWTEDSSPTALLSPIDPSTSTSLADSDVSMGEASKAGPSSRRRQGPNPFVPNELRAQILTTPHGLISSDKV
ncbi:hypothetical protein BY996DRAFT_8688598 [Phakopsora pachyrhizi]|nr:hypothetical protein BY996DRAFT_8688598 [Phakopsora pachyrhizi]